MVGIRGSLAQQGILGGGERLLAEVRHQDELGRRVVKAIEGGSDPDLARSEVADEMLVERLREAFGAEVVKVDPDELGNPN